MNIPSAHGRGRACPALGFPVSSRLPYSCGPYRTSLNEVRVMKKCAAILVSLALLTACSAAPACTSVSACPWAAARTAAVSAAGSGADECLPAAADRSGSSRSAMNSCLRCTIRRLIQLQSNGIISEAAILICEEALRVRRPRHIRPSWRRLPARPPSECPAFP